MALDCGSMVFIHIPRTSGRWTRKVLLPLRLGEVGGYHELPPEFQPGVLYWCWDRPVDEWVASVRRYMMRPSDWWQSVGMIQPTWAHIRTIYLFKPEGFDEWLVNKFLPHYYEPSVERVPWTSRAEWMCQWAKPWQIATAKKVSS